MEKLLSIAIPSYNSQEYMAKAIESLLPGGDAVEILIVDDGSRDDTARIADEYAAKYPGIVRAIHQENGGHGGAVMTGLRNATGLYFKVVDSDDWIDAEAYPRVLKQLSELTDPDKQVDLFLCNYIYDKVGAIKKHVVRYHNLPMNRTFTWKEAGRFKTRHYILMHSAIYRTDMLRGSGLELPRHTFYVDNLYVYVPMTGVEKLYYMDEELYHYFIGREDQSVQEQIMIRRIDQQIRVNELMLDAVDLTKIEEPAKRTYMFKYFEIITSVSSVLLIRSGTDENYAKMRELWAYIEKQSPEVYRRLRRRPFGFFLHIPGKVGRTIISVLYGIAQKFYGFN